MCSGFFADLPSTKHVGPAPSNNRKSDFKSGADPGFDSVASVATLPQPSISLSQLCDNLQRYRWVWTILCDKGREQGLFRLPTVFRFKWSRMRLSPIAQG